MGLPEEVKPIWRTVQIVQITRGLDTGLAVFIVGPYLYDLFQKAGAGDKSLIYISTIWAIFYGLIALLEIPTGALGDVVGRTRIIIASFLLHIIYGVVLVGLIFCKRLETLFVFALFSRFVSALAFTFFNGSFSAWVVDSLRESAPGFSYERLLGRGAAYSSWSMILGSLIGVAAYLHGIPHIAFLAKSFLCLGCVTYCMGMMEETRSLIFMSGRRLSFALFRDQMLDTIRTGVRVCNRWRALWWLLGSFAAYHLLLNVVDFLWPVVMSAQFGTKKWTPEWYGMVVAVSLLGALGSHALTWRGDGIQKRTGQRMSNTSLRRWLLASEVFAAVPIIALGIATRQGVISFPLLAFAVLAVEFAYGVVTPCFDTLMNNYIPPAHSQERATILSMGSMIRSVFVLLLMVPSSGRSGITSPAAWILPAGILLVSSLVVEWRLRTHDKHASSTLIPSGEEVAL